MTSLAVQPAPARPVAADAADGVGPTVIGGLRHGSGRRPEPGPRRELDLVVSAVQRQRPAADPDEVALLVAAVAARLAARHPADGYFPVLVHGAVLSLLPR